MFRCTMCGEVSSPGEKPRRFTSDKRLQKHPYRPDAFKQRVKVPGHRKMHLCWLPDRGGEGYQIVREESCCTTCYDTLKEEASEY